MKGEGEQVFYCRNIWCWWPVLVVLVFVCVKVEKVIRVYVGLGEIVWGSLALAAFIILVGTCYFFYLWSVRIRINEAGIGVERIFKPSFPFVKWNGVTEVKEGKIGMNRWLVLKSDKGKVNIGMLEVGKKQYDLLCRLTETSLKENNPGILDKSGRLAALDSKKMMRRRLFWVVPLAVCIGVSTGHVHSFSLFSVPGNREMGMILYCGIRHERDVEKARRYLDAPTFDWLESMSKEPERALLLQYGEITRDEAYAIGCLKAGGLLTWLSGTAEDWLKLANVSHSSRLILERLKK